MPTMYKVYDINHDASYLFTTAQYIEHLEKQYCEAVGKYGAVYDAICVAFKIHNSGRIFRACIAEKVET